MFTKLYKKLIGTKSDREIKKITYLADEINEIYKSLASVSEEELRAKSQTFRDQIAAVSIKIREQFPDKDEEELDSLIHDAEQEELNRILPEAFAIVKEACRRLEGKSWDVCDQKITWDMIPYDVQLIGAVILHQGKIAEMATGEGKTLVATMPLYLNALTGRGVQLITVNDYLAKRDSEWMGKIYEMLGVSVGCILNEMDSEERKETYKKDIVYGTNNEFGFDYLRDNMAIRAEDTVQRSHHYAIVDEVDSVLIDEARTPLIISGPVSVSTHKFKELKSGVEQLFRNQTLLVNKLLADITPASDEGEDGSDDFENGVKLFLAHRGAPKNKKLLKLLNEAGTKKLMRRVENEYLIEKKNMGNKSELVGRIEESLHFHIDEKTNVIELADKGREALSPNDPAMWILPDLAEEEQAIDADESLSAEDKLKKQGELHRIYGEKAERLHNISQLLKAYSLFEKDVEYVVQDGKVLIVDEFTGRLMVGRRYSDGLHQALEAKENVQIERETQTLATITLQNYFRLYSKLAGMTGTALTEADEFFEIYKLDSIAIPTNRPMIRIDNDDQVFRTKREKYNAVVKEIEEMVSNGRPVLVGTTSVDVSETLSRMLKRRGVRHSVLNAKHHQQEAEIISNAGRAGSVTIATNMAGRGTDIKLGQGVRESGGLHIIGTERHESRRIDLQLRGRSARQGDPGSTRFYLSLEDNLMRLFGSERIAGVMDRLGAQEGEVIQHPLITRSIQRAQKRVEMHNFEIRKHLLEYDNVMNQQREVVYDRRAAALRGGKLKDEVLQIMDEYIEDIVNEYTDSKTYPEEWNLDGLNQELLRTFIMKMDWDGPDKKQLTQEILKENISEKAREYYRNREKLIGEELMLQLERIAVLRVIDERWKEHLYEMDMLKEGIGLRAYGQKDPLIEYKREGYQSFIQMLGRTNKETLEFIFRAQFAPADSQEDRRSQQRLSASHESATGLGFQGASSASAGEGPPRAGKKKPVKVEKKVGRNEPCPCGSGKKYKKCHGKV